MFRRVMCGRKKSSIATVFCDTQNVDLNPVFWQSNTSLCAIPPVSQRANPQSSVESHSLGSQDTGAQKNVVACMSLKNKKTL